MCLSIAATALLIPAVFAQQYLYVTEGQFDLKKYDLNGNYIATIINGPNAFSDWADGLAIRASDGHFFIPATYSGTVNEYDSNGNFIGNFITGISGYVDELAFDSSGNLYIAQGDTGNVIKYSPTGSSLGTFLSGLSEPTGVAFNSVGDAYVTQWYTLGYNGLSIWKWNHLTSTLSVFAAGPYNYMFGGLEVDASGNVYLSQYNEGTVIKFDPDGNYLGVLISGLNSPEGLAIAPIPEPATYALLSSLAIGGIGFINRKKSLSKNS